MIRKLTLNNIATFTQAVEIEPTTINYFYGSNGSGKTTLSKVIADESVFSDCALTWQNQPIETLVYNRDFVKSHFSQSRTIKGIFTLGKDATEAKAFIETTTKAIEVHTTALTALNHSLETKNTEIKTLDDGIIEKCWSTKGRYEQNFREAYTGFIGSKPAFFNKCKQEQNNTSDLLAFDDIKEKCQRVFSKTLQAYTPIQPIQLPDFDALENDPILTTKIVGKEDLPIASLVTKLGNSDWIKQGVGFLEQTENQCPFCQQPISATLQDEIESVFDDSYQQKISELAAYQSNYAQTIASIIDKLKEVIKLEIPILDFTELKSHIRLLEEAYKNNLTSIDQKVKSPSSEVVLSPLSNDFKKAQSIIESYRTTIQNNNATANNIKTEKATLKSEIWWFIAEELSPELTTYKTELSGLKSGKKSIEDQITQRTTDKRSLEGKIKEKEADITSVIHTKNEINKILKSFGFTNFSISEADSEDGYYKIIRQNGADAKETLSEGEYTFITFLYFYQLLKGSINETGLTTDKVIVIDDPISSLDSNVLFIVSNLIKEVVADCRNQTNAIKQIFILTHNIYFHKEVTFKGSRQGQWKEESFWIVRSLNNQSKIIKHDENPIQTTYELLWREINIPIEQINKATVFNTMRRILEYYFNIIGGLDYEKSINEFDGEEKIIFKSLFSWINDGSHFINDDLVVYTEPENIEKQLAVFKGVFTKLKHECHYNMMMGIENE